MIFDSVPLKKSPLHHRISHLFLHFFPPILSKQKLHEEVFHVETVEVLVNCRFEPLSTPTSKPTFCGEPNGVSGSGTAVARDEFDCDFAQLAAARFGGRPWGVEKLQPPKTNIDTGTIVFVLVYPCQPSFFRGPFESI